MDADQVSGGDRFEIKGRGSLAALRPVLKALMTASSSGCKAATGTGPSKRFLIHRTCG